MKQGRKIGVLHSTMSTEIKTKQLPQEWVDVRMPPADAQLLGAALRDAATIGTLTCFSDRERERIEWWARELETQAGGKGPEGS